MTMEKIPVFFTFDKNYVVAAEVAIYSMLKHASPAYEYKLYVLHTDIPRKAQKELTKLINRFRNTSLEFIDTSAFDSAIKNFHNKSHFSKEIFYKLIASEIFPQYDRIICSDVDVVFTGDISPSYFMYEHEKFYFAGVGQIIENNRMNTYGNQFTDAELQILKKEIAAGYLLMNLKHIRENQMQQKLTGFYAANYHRLRLPEQDCIILCCYPDVRYLPMEYVVCNSYYKYEQEKSALIFYNDNDSIPKDPIIAEEMFTCALRNPIQLHYVGERKPWNSFPIPKQKLWYSVLRESGYTSHWIRALPRIILKKYSRYSLKRFISKIKKRMTQR